MKASHVLKFLQESILFQDEVLAVLVQGALINAIEAGFDGVEIHGAMAI